MGKKNCGKRRHCDQDETVQMGERDTGRLRAPTFVGSIGRVHTVFLMQVWLIASAVCILKEYPGTKNS